MRIKIYPYLIVIVLMLAFAACKKNTPVPIKSKPDTTKTDTNRTDTTKKDTSSLDIYVAGVIGNDAVYWKNGVVKDLGPGWVYSLAVDNGDVYVAGYAIAKNNNAIAAYWKNGVLTKLSDSSGSSQINSIYVVGQDVYAVGIVMDGFMGNVRSVYWKNGLATQIASGNTIVVNNGNVYIGGSTNGVPTYWKNGVPTALDLHMESAGGVTTIAFDGNDMYIGGSISTSTTNVAACYWENGVLTFLDPNSSFSYVYGAAIQGHTAVFAGFTTTPGGKQVAAYWKNNIQTLLADTSLFYSTATGIATNGNDIYVSGEYETTSSAYNGYWKNGTMVTLGGGVTCIVVVPRKH